MNKNYRNSFERKQYIDSIIEEYRVKNINQNSDSNSKKGLKSNEYSNTNSNSDLYRQQQSIQQQQQQQIKPKSKSKPKQQYDNQQIKNDNDRYRNNNNRYESESTISTTFNKNQMSDEYQKTQGLGQIKDEQPMYKSLYCQHQQSQQQMDPQQDRLSDIYNNEYQIVSNNKQSNHSNPTIINNNTNTSDNKHWNINQNHNQIEQKNTNECVIKINGIDHSINLNDIPSKLFNQSIRNSVYMSNQFKPIINKHQYQKRDWKIQDFKVIKQLGNGKYGEVYLCKDIITDFMVAIKVINQKVIEKEDLEKQLAREIMIHSYLKHSNILEMYGWFRDPYNVYLVLEYCQQGELFKLLSKQKQLRFSEEMGSHYIKQVIEALLYLKQQQVIHRDVKPENILVSNENIKLCDFGWSVYDDHFQTRMTFCGTADYVSPEMINNEKYDCRVDTWSVGVLTYELLTGKPPFSSNLCGQYNDNQMGYQMIFRNIIQHKKEQIQFPDYVSNNACQFIRSILEKNQEQRAQLKYLKRDKWIIENCKEDQRIAQIKAKVKQFL